MHIKYGCLEQCRMPAAMDNRKLALQFKYYKLPLIRVGLHFCVGTLFVPNIR